MSVSESSLFSLKSESNRSLKKVECGANGALLAHRWSVFLPAQATLMSTSLAVKLSMAASRGKTKWIRSV